MRARAAVLGLAVLVVGTSTVGLWGVYSPRTAGAAPPSDPTPAVPAASGTVQASVDPAVAVAGTIFIVSFSATNTSSTAQNLAIISLIPQPESVFEPAGPGTNCALEPHFPPGVGCTFDAVPPGGTVHGSYPYRALRAGTVNMDVGLYDHSGTAIADTSVTITVQAGSSAGGSRLAVTPDGSGYWVSQADGTVGAFGTAVSYGSMAGQPLNAPVVGITATPDGKGYWEVAADGGVFSFGDAVFAGSQGGQALNAPVVGMASNLDGSGYWLVTSDGGVINFGRATPYGSMAGQPLNRPVVAMERTPAGSGYWLVAADGGVFAFGDAGFFGSKGGQPLNQPMVGVTTSPDGNGYWLVASDGGVFTFGNAAFFGSLGGTTIPSPIVGLFSTALGAGYSLVDSAGGSTRFGAGAT
ncbi:MAG: hypothetical protein QOJ44_138 [Acidimicrobiaceae bacterium]|jgi:hypothetical protein|nr:hypothetical protein [Acidimicrobiaceae bacterium]